MRIFAVGLAIHAKLSYPSEKIKLGSLDHKRDCGSRAVLDEENTAPGNEFNHRFANDKGQLNLQLNCDGVWECREGEFRESTWPIYS